MPRMSMEDLGLEVGRSADWLGSELSKLGLDPAMINRESRALGTKCADAFCDGDDCQPRQLAELRLAEIRAQFGKT